MKTINELAHAHGVHRTTLNKAIERKAFTAALFGKTYVVDEQADDFKRWLAGAKRGRPRKTATEVSEVIS